MDSPRASVGGGARSSELPTRPSPNFWHGDRGPTSPSFLKLGERVALVVYPRYFVRKGPWIAEGRVLAINSEGVTITRTLDPGARLGAAFKAAFYIPTLYFEEGRVFKSRLTTREESE